MELWWIIAKHKGKSKFKISSFTKSIDWNSLFSVHLFFPLHNSVLSFSNYSIYLFIVNTKTIEQFVSHLNSRQFHYLSFLVIVGYSHSIYTNQIETTNSIDIHIRSQITKSISILYVTILLIVLVQLFRIV